MLKIVKNELYLILEIKYPVYIVENIKKWNDQFAKAFMFV